VIKLKSIKKGILFATCLVLPLLAGCTAQPQSSKQIEIVEDSGNFQVIRDKTTKCKYLIVEKNGEITSQALLKPDGNPLCE
jgi:hypothetical protein